MSSLFHLTVIYRTICMICGNTEEENYKMAQGASFRSPVLPEGWSVVDGSPVCPKHEVKILTKKEKV